MSRLKTRGEGNVQTKLKENEVKSIRFLYRYTDMTEKDLTLLYNISTTQIWRIIHNENWAWL